MEQEERQATIAKNDDDDSSSVVVDDRNSAVGTTIHAPTTVTEETNVSLTAKGRLVRPPLQRVNSEEDAGDDDDNLGKTSATIAAVVASRPAEEAGKQPPPPEKYNDDAVPNSSQHEAQEQSQQSQPKEQQSRHLEDDDDEDVGILIAGATSAADHGTEKDPTNCMTKETQHRAMIPTTAVLNLSPYQRAQLAHLKSIFDQTRNTNDTTNTTGANIKTTTTTTTIVNVLDNNNHCDHHHENEDDMDPDDVEYNWAVRQLRDHMKRMKEEQERKLLLRSSSVARAPFEAAAAKVVDLTNDEDDNVVIIDERPAVTEQQHQQPQPQHMGRKRKLPEDRHEATNSSERSRGAVPVATTVAAQSMPLSTSTTSVRGDIPSEAQTQDEPHITAQQLRQAQQEYDIAKAVYSTKQRHCNVLVAQRNKYASLVEARGDTNLDLLSRQISIFRPFLLEAKAKMNECELRLKEIKRNMPR